MDTFFYGAIYFTGEGDMTIKPVKVSTGANPERPGERRPRVSRRTAMQGSLLMRIAEGIAARVKAEDVAKFWEAVMRLNFEADERIYWSTEPARPIDVLAAVARGKAREPAVEPLPRKLCDLVFENPDSTPAYVAEIAIVDGVRSVVRTFAPHRLNGKMEKGPRAPFGATAIVSRDVAQYSVAWRLADNALAQTIISGGLDWLRSEIGPGSTHVSSCPRPYPELVDAFALAVLLRIQPILNKARCGGVWRKDRWPADVVHIDKKTIHDMNLDLYGTNTRPVLGVAGWTNRPALDICLALEFLMGTSALRDASSHGNNLVEAKRYIREREMEKQAAGATRTP